MQGSITGAKLYAFCWIMFATYQFLFTNTMTKIIYEFTTKIFILKSCLLLCFRQDDIDVISSETSSLSFDSNIQSGQTIHHTPTRHEPSQVYYQPGRTHIYQRKKRAYEAPARYHSHHNQHIINIPLR